VLDDSDSSIRELSLSLVAEMLHNQKDPMEESIEIVLEKLLHVTKDVVAKVNFPHLGSPLASGLIPF
jgi:CLIP-associating protein 1/2